MFFVTIPYGIEYLIYGPIIQENWKLQNKRGQKARKLSKRNSGSQSLWEEQLLKGPSLSSCKNIKENRRGHCTEEPGRWRALRTKETELQSTSLVLRKVISYAIKK